MVGRRLLGIRLEDAIKLEREFADFKSVSLVYQAGNTNSLVNRRFQAIHAAPKRQASSIIAISTRSVELK